MQLVYHDNGIFDTKGIGNPSRLYPDEELGIAGSNDCGLSLHSKTPLLEILQLLDQKPGLAHDKRNEAVSRFFLRLVEVFGNFEHRICRHTHAAIV